MPKQPNGCMTSSEQPCSPTPCSSTAHSSTTHSPTPPPNYVLRKIAEKPVASSYSTWQPHYPMPTQRSPAAPITPSGVSSYPPKSESPKSIPGQFPLKRDDLHGILKNYIPSSTFYQLVEEFQVLRSEMQTLKQKTKKAAKT